jgi:hypothetical protein
MSPHPMSEQVRGRDFDRQSTLQQSHNEFA